jgi:thiamine pyrophosphokinase
MSFETVILANGSFPRHKIPLEIIRNAVRIICCDGSTGNLVRAGYEPHAIVGDLDSLEKEIAEKYSDRLFRDENQETNDLTKAVTWCSDHGFKDIAIIGGTGKREDHTLGNISLLAEYAREVNVTMVTDTGVFMPFLRECSVASFPGQPVSIFSIDPETEITSSGLKYRLDRIKLHNWWRATLNEAEGDSFELKFTGGPVIVYLKFRY